MIEFKPIKVLANWYEFKPGSGHPLHSGSIWALREDGLTALMGVEYIRGAGYFVFDIWTGLVAQRYNTRKEMLERMVRMEWYSPDMPDAHYPRWMIRHAGQDYFRKAHSVIAGETAVRRCVPPSVAKYLAAPDIRTAMEEVDL